MSRIKHPTTNKNMGRSRLSSPSKDTITDDGSVLISIIDGEQIQIQMTVSWMTNLSSATITAKVVEGNNDGTGAVPLETLANPTVVNLAIIDSDNNDNMFKIVIPEDLASLWATQPSPNKPSYGFIGLEIDDGGVGSAKQVWKPLRGLVEVLYSPSEA
jgi:hypothetical protein